MGGGIRAKATEDGYVAVEALVFGFLLSFDMSKENALKLAGEIIEAADDLDEGRRQ